MFSRLKKVDDKIDMRGLSRQSENFEREKGWKVGV